MAEFYLQTHIFLSTKWKEILLPAQEIENTCIQSCDSNILCEENCRRPIKELMLLAEEKQELYVRKGVEYCKSQCWNAADLSKCCKKCVSEYSIVLNDYKNSLIDHYKSTRFYNT